MVTELRKYEEKGIENILAIAAYDTFMPFDDPPSACARTQCTGNRTNAVHLAYTRNPVPFILRLRSSNI